MDLTFYSGRPMRSDSWYKLTIKVFTDVKEEGNLLADVYRSGSPFEIIGIAPWWP